MARTVFIDCIRRDPDRSLRAVAHEVRSVRPGATTLVVTTDSRRTVGLVRDWAQSRKVSGTVSRQGRQWQARLYLMPDDFGSLPICARQVRREGVPHLGAQRSQHAEAAVTPHFMDRAG